MFGKQKYSNKKTVVDGVTFDSKAEAKRWHELLLLVRAGQIADLERQVRYELAPSVKFPGDARAKPALTYWADFRYCIRETGTVIVEDTKGVATEAYRIKKHLMMSVHGIAVKDHIKAR
jgi:hypothetical protein